MKRIMFISLRTQMVQDLEVGHLMGDFDTYYELKCLQSIDNLDQEVEQWHPGLVVLSYDALKKRDSWAFKGAEVAFHAINREELELGAAYGYPTVGIADTASALLEKLKGEPYMARKPGGGERKPSGAQKGVRQPGGKEPAQIKGSAGAQEPVQPHGAARQERHPGERTPAQWTDDTSTGGMSGDGAPRELEELGDEFDFLDSLDSDDGDGDPAEGCGAPDGAVREPAAQDTRGSAPAPQASAREDLGDRAQGGDAIDREFLKDVKGEPQKTKVVTVYSAKGGVGKTTIATELALYLSLVSLGRRNLRICLVDYNIDFGDVKGTLALKDEGPNLTFWAEEVQSFLDSGKSPSEINYSREGVEEWLRVYKDTGLYVLLAPLTNEDSMRVSSDALEVILSNIVRNGGFDYVICDTGNNTRDSTMVALEHADTILLIMTQNVNTAFCDKAFMNTMRSIDFDMSRAKLVINYIMPQKSTGITVQEIVDYFPYECIGKIRFNTDVIAATNLGRPLAVYQPGHDFIAQMRSIVTYLLKSSDFTAGKKARKPLFGFLGLKRKR